MEVIKTQELTKYYHHQITKSYHLSKNTRKHEKSRGIVDLNLSVSEGDFFGYIGPNGAGKSTTIRTLLGLIKADSGMASVFGMDIAENRTALLNQIGYLPSEAVFYNNMKVRDVLKLSADLRKTDCSTESKRLCERLQLDTSKKIDALSFGNRKKVGIVCALQHKPRLYILDEPTSGLDPLMQREFFALLKERNEEGATVFLSSHILSEIQRNCNRAAIISGGRIIACDSVENLAKTNAKRVTIHALSYKQSIPGHIFSDFSQIEYVRDIQVQNDTISFLYSGDINALLLWLSTKQIRDLSIAEPDLEEIFMHYYSEGGETK